MDIIISFSVHLDLADGDGDSVPMVLAKLAGGSLSVAVEKAVENIPGVEVATVGSVVVRDMTQDALGFSPRRLLGVVEDVHDAMEES